MDFVDEFYADKDLSLLKKLTLVIPTYNRNYYLSRCLWYHAHFPFGEIIVADSSPKKEKERIKKMILEIESLSKTTITYLEYEPESMKYGEDIYRKWADALFHVKSEYSLICTDKEFLIPTTAVKCIDYLDQNDDYDTADGQCYTIKYNPQIQKSKYYQLVPYDISYDQSTPDKRIDALTSPRKNNPPQCSCLPAIHRTEFHKYIYKCILDFSLEDIRFGDFMPQFLSILCSKRIHFLDDPYVCRDLSNLISSNNTINNAESSAYRYPRIEDYALDHKYNLCRKNAIACTSFVLNNKTKIDTNVSETAEYLTDKFLKQYSLKVDETLYEKTSINKLFHRLYSLGYGILHSDKYNNIFHKLPISIIGSPLKARLCIYKTMTEIDKRVELCNKIIIEFKKIP